MKGSHITGKQIGQGAIILAAIDVAVTLLFTELGSTYHLGAFDWRILSAAFLACFGLFAYGHHIVTHSSRIVMKMKEPKPAKYGTYDFRVVAGRQLKLTHNWLAIKGSTWADRFSETSYQLRHGSRYAARAA